MRYIYTEHPVLVGKFTHGAVVTITITKLSTSESVIVGAACTEIGSSGYFQYTYTPSSGYDEYLWTMTDGTDEVAGDFAVDGFIGTVTGEYGGDPANSVTDEMRLLCGDTGSTSYLSNVEYTYYYNKYGVHKGAYKACLAIASKCSGETQISLGDLSISGQQVADQYAKRAAELKREYSREISGAYTIPTLGRTRDSVDFPTELLHSDYKPKAKWYDPSRSSSDYEMDDTSVD